MHHFTTPLHSVNQSYLKRTVSARTTIIVCVCVCVCVCVLEGCARVQNIIHIFFHLRSRYYK